VGKIKIAVDSCVVIMLSHLASKNMSDSDNAVLECLRKGTLSPDLYKNTPNKNLPPLLKDKYLGSIETGNDGKAYYSNLMNAYRLWSMIEKGTCEAYITPAVEGELSFDWFEEQIEFIKKYINIIEVADNDADKFYQKRDRLAWDYVNSGAMNESYNAAVRASTPQNDAYIMAEASLCGLVLVTVNNKDFINYNNYAEDYKRVNLICEVNKKQGLYFNSNIKNYVIFPQPYTLSSFIMRAKFRKDGHKKAYYIVNPNLDDSKYVNNINDRGVGI
jgi:hypothetical protein